MTEDELDAEIAWIKAKSAALQREGDALWGLQGDARQRADDDVTRRWSAVRAAIARCWAAIDRRNERPKDRLTLH